MVLLKKGAPGQRLLRCASGGSPRRPSRPRRSIPTGAGDCFGGTFVACLALGVPVERALRLANAAGALAVGKKGPMEGNSTMAELEAFLARQAR